MSDLKKHIYRKFYNEISTDEKIIEKLTSLKETKNIEGLQWEKVKTGEVKVGSIPKDKKALLLMDNNKAVFAFPFNHKGEIRLIPEPDPILIYFHTAYVYFTKIEEKREQVLVNSSIQVMTEKIIDDLYEYYGLTCSFVIILFTSLEAFINRSIPDDFEYRKTLNKKTEVYSKQQIQWLSIEEKMKEVMPVIKKRDFGKSHPTVQQILDNLKEFRNSIVHTRESKEGHTPFDYLFKRSFKFDYKQALNAVKDYCNFYHGANYIVECPCSKEW